MIDFYQEENFFNENESKLIDDCLFNESFNFPLFFHNEQCDGDGIPFFSHSLINRNGDKVSNFTEIFLSLVERFILQKSNLKPKKILRSCINITLPMVGKTAVHVDHDEEYYQVICYLNDATGNTVIFDDNGSIVKSVEPKKGRIIMFNKLKHKANLPSIPNKIRAVMVTTFKI